jgi:hypothetical protein
VHFAFEFEHLLATEEAAERGFTGAMKVMVYGGESGDGDRTCAACVELMNPFVANAAGSSVDFVGEGGVGAVQFIGVDSRGGVGFLLSGMNSHISYLTL